MNKTYLEISISATEAQREMLLPTMTELGCNGFQETDDALLCYVDRSRWTPEHARELEEALKRILRSITVNASITFREIADTNWNAEWERSIQPITVGDRFLISPSWHEPANPENRILLRIDPKMSFGTGYHETTRLVLRLLESYTPRGCRMLDVGTGTGILAIAAVKLGAASATGIDNDDWSIRNALENIVQNHAEGIVTISPATTGEFPPAAFDLITANITLNTNIEMLPEFRRILKPGGVALFSGLLDYDRETMLTNLGKFAFEVIEERSENEWIAIAARTPR
jgi:ribosomal protein L11 methyltransferase